MSTPQFSHPDVQLNLGHFNRFSGRDYFEINRPESVQMFLLTTPSAKLDEMAIDNEHLFKLRFGFDANPRIRAQIIAIKHKYELTDEELRSLRQAGQMSIRRHEARIAPARGLAIIGWISAVLFTIICVICSWAVQGNSAVGWRQGLGLLIIGLTWLALIWFVGKVHLDPWRILKQIGAVGAVRKGVSAGTSS
ncbi:MAG: hypothetical protein ACM3VZ_15345 [Acidobacteriota bacterium]